MESLSQEYEAIRRQWAEMTAAQAAHWSKWRERKLQIEKDVIRTDRDAQHLRDVESPDLERMKGVLLSYVMYNQDLGYSQGMSDVLSPLIVIMPTEVEVRHSLERSDSRAVQLLSVWDLVRGRLASALLSCCPAVVVSV
jgi:hypothetical protein